MLQVLFRIPIQIPGLFPDGVPIYGFGMMLFLAFLLCTWLAGRRAEREGISKETVQDLAIWVFGGGLLGRQVCSLLNRRPLPSFGEFFADLPRIWDGGIILYGAVIGGTLSYFVAYFLYFRQKGVQTRRLTDAVAPAIALGLVLGRFGCFLNGCCFGGVTCEACAVPTAAVGFPLSAPPREVLVRQGTQTAAGFTLEQVSLPGLPPLLTSRVELVDPESPAYAAGLRPGDRIFEVNSQDVRDGSDIGAALSLETWKRGAWALAIQYERGGETHHATIRPRTLPLYPTQMYEVVSMALLMLVLLAYERFRRNPGQVLAVLMVGYGAHRYLNEILRDDPRPVGFEAYGSVVLVAGGVALWVWLQWFKKADGPVEPVGDAAKAPADAIKGP